MTPLDVDRVAPEACDGIRILPVLHERVDLAAVARLVLEAVDPAAVAVELPTTLVDAVRTAVHRMPKITLVVSEEPGEEALVWTAKAALFFCGCLVEIGLASQVGVKSGCVCWRCGVLYSPLLLIGGVFVPPTA